MRPIPRRVSSGRSPAVPMITVIGAVRPAPPAAIPSATSITAEIPASLWAKSTMTTREPSRNRLSRPGERSDDGAKSINPSRTCASAAPRPRAPPAAARAFATLCRASPPIVIGTRRTSTIDDARSPSSSTSSPSRTTYARPPEATWRRTTAGVGVAVEKNATCPRTRRAIAATRGSSPLRTTQPSGLVTRQIVDLTSANSGSVWMPWRSRWSDETFVSTEASFDS